MGLDTLSVLETLVETNTVSDRDKGKRASSECPKYITKTIEDFGFTTDILESEGYWSAFGRKGDGDKKILFLAHFDTVPPGKGWKTDPFELVVEGNRAYGRGTCDDKGNIVSMLLLAEKLQTTNPSMTVMLAATGDEEIGGAHGAGNLRNYLDENGLMPDYVVVADGIGQVIIHRRRNALPTHVKVKKHLSQMKGEIETKQFQTDLFGSDTRHSAYQRPGVDRHALLAASKYLDLHPFAGVTKVEGAFVKSNVIPDWIELEIVHPDESGATVDYDQGLTDLLRAALPMAQAAFPTEHSDMGKVVSPNLLELKDGVWDLYLDVRAMTNDSESAKKAFQESLRGKAEVTSLTVGAGQGYVDSDPNSQLIKAARKALDRIGIKTRLIEGGGASDSRYFAGENTQVFDFGPIGDNLHGANEWVLVPSIEENAEFFYELINILS
ncbi:MAG: M20/M25/M40 family metallo-hydrolase [Candidatus Lokiarchaeota archaeon]|nr:M20/M25/M40 family metallo-hydrolase [Candidatus Lokiarchaeota archaeon]